jgi:hypothetical protein
MHKNATKFNKTQSKWCINKHEASKIIDTFETYQRHRGGMVQVERQRRCVWWLDQGEMAGEWLGRD